MLDITQNSVSVASAQVSNTQKQVDKPAENASAKNGFRLRTIPSDSGGVLTNIAKSRRLSPTEKSGLIRQLATFDTIKAEDVVRRNVISNIQQVASYMEQSSKVISQPTPIEQVTKQYERVQQAVAQQPAQNRTVDRVQQNLENFTQQNRGVSVREAVQAQTRQANEVRDSIEVRQAPEQRVAPQENVTFERPQPAVPAREAQVALPGQASQEAEAAPLPGSGANGGEFTLPGGAGGAEAAEFALPGGGTETEVVLPGGGASVETEAYVPVSEVAAYEEPANLVEAEQVEAAPVELVLPGGDDASEAAETELEVAHVQTYA